MHSKTLLTVLTAFTIIYPFRGFSQDEVSEATLEYKISATSLKKPVPPGLEGATFTIFIKPFESRSEFRNAAGVETIYFDNKKGKGAISKEYSGQKLLITINRENWEEKSRLYNNLQFNEQDGAENVAGFSVRAASASLPGGEILELLYAPGIRLSNLQYNYAFPQIPGLPVKFEIESGGVLYTYLLNKINTDPLPPSKFVIPQNGFRIMSYEENIHLQRN